MARKIAMLSRHVICAPHVMLRRMTKYKGLVMPEVIAFVIGAIILIVLIELDRNDS